jgi:hypothetical protein
MTVNKLVRHVQLTRHGFRLADFAAIVVVCSLTAGCGRTVNRSAERHIRDLLPDLIGNARQYRVHVNGDAGAAAQGKLAFVTVDGDDIQMTNGLLIDHLHLEMTNVNADLVHKQLRSVGSASFTASIGEASLDEFLAGESPDSEPGTLRNVHISLRRNQVTISAERVLLGASIPFRAYGPLRLSGPHRIELDPTRLVVVGIPISGVPLEFLKRRFESAIDLSSLPVPILLHQVHTENRTLIMTGVPDIAAILRNRADGSAQ